ncbi:hypothetical protein BC830DRAFT_649547 [Chytriomyces sp. MP71]|nr:hypothetical protein BC830DRAFT_649547 [Chytriomyces sp. MP71]
MSHNASPSETVSLSTSAIYWALVAVSCLQLVALLKFIILDETLRDTMKLTIKNVATPFNFLLLFMPLSNSSIYLGILCEVSAQSDAAFKLALLANVAGALLTQLIYITYIWLRGEPIVEAAFPAAVPYLRLVLMLFKLIFGVSLIPTLLTFFNLPVPIGALLSINGYLQAACGCCTVTFDLFIVVVFVRYLKSISNSGESGVAIVDDKLQLIARYGIASSSVGLSMLAVYGACMVVDDENAYVILLQTVFASFSVVWVILFCMKRSLHFLKLQKKGMSSATKCNTDKVRQSSSFFLSTSKL